MEFCLQFLFSEEPFFDSFDEIILDFHGVIMG
jgi:hypothetical protein